MAVITITILAEEHVEACKVWIGPLGKDPLKTHDDHRYAYIDRPLNLSISIVLMLVELIFGVEVTTMELTDRKFIGSISVNPEMYKRFDPDFMGFAPFPY